MRTRSCDGSATRSLTALADAHRRRLPSDLGCGWCRNRPLTGRAVSTPEQSTKTGNRFDGFVEAGWFRQVLRTKAAARALGVGEQVFGGQVGDIATAVERQLDVPVQGHLGGDGAFEARRVVPKLVNLAAHARMARTSSSLPQRNAYRCQTRRVSCASFTGTAASLIRSSALPSDGRFSSWARAADSSTDVVPGQSSRAGHAASS